ncbi:MAG: hypothetical protein ACR2QK_20950, partial [Acidimicrobiales bacterium]
RRWVQRRERSELVNIDLESLRGGPLRSRMVLQLAAVLAVVGVGLAGLALLNRDESDSAKIETTDLEVPDDEVALEQVGAEELSSPGTLRVDGVAPLGNDEESSIVADPATGSETGGVTTVAGDTSAGAGSSNSNPAGSSAPGSTSAGAARSGNPTSSSTGPGSSSGAGGSGSNGTPGSGPAGTNPTGSSSPIGGGSNPTVGSSPTSPTSSPTSAAPPGGGSGAVAAAAIPFSNNGVGDGATGGSSPYAPPRANLGFQDLADQSVSTVQANCSSSSVDCAAEIKSIMNSNRTRPLKITFGDPGRRGAEVAFRSPIRLQSDVYLEGVNQPKLIVTAGSILFNVSGTRNVSIRNFDLDLQGCRGNSNAVVAASSPVENLYVSGLNVLNAQPNATGYCENDFIRLGFSAGSAKNIHVYGNQVSRLRRFVRVQGDVDTIKVYNNEIREIGFEGYVQTFQSISRNVTIEGNVFSRHSPNATAGHMIGFPISKAASPMTYARNVVVRNNLVEGIPNTPHVKIDGKPQPTGGAGDLIALRGIDGFMLEGNVVRHSGEVGITATAGLRNGTIRYNQVSYTDTTGIVLGNEAANSNERVSNVDVYRNEMFQNSLDRNREYTDRDHPTFSLWNTVDSCMVNNYIHHNSNSNGFWVWNGNNSTWPASVFDVYIADNRFNDNKRDFVESPKATPPYGVASPTGGANWTSTYAGSVDRDNDGLPSQCVTERNDNDPCSPDIYAEACRR